MRKSSSKGYVAVHSTIQSEQLQKYALQLDFSNHNAYSKRLILELQLLNGLFSIHSGASNLSSPISFNFQKYIFVPLDIFKKIQHNENRTIKIENRLDAWLAFLCMDEPETIIEIIERYPDFKEMYEQVYEICRNIEEVMNMFSKELLELDRNTTKLMIDEMQKDIEHKDEVILQKDNVIHQKNDMILQKDDVIHQKDEEIRKLKEALQKAKN